ncbi:MAG: aminotransferase class I/II-fold pyridoxal phosphate-dependent enzyme, partial [Clostridia bacterium]|nr:aminotransferase class I/II-fold pyridoxal phosphate-dependent enzyme [Clostridia bacterium]
MDYKNYLNTSAYFMKPSGIRKFFDLAAKMEGVISLGVGEPDFKTDWSIRNAAIHSVQKGITQYTANAGLLSLRREISDYLNSRYNVSYLPEKEILVTVGASEGIDLSLRALINPGDEILIPEPSYVSYAPCVVLSGGVPVSVDCKFEEEFKLNPEVLESKITDK